jgi:hypothetical protein
VEKFMVRFVDGSVITIEDERGFETVAGILARDGVLITEDVTPTQGRPDYRRRVAIYSRTVILIGAPSGERGKHQKVVP